MMANQLDKYMHSDLTDFGRDTFSVLNSHGLFWRAHYLAQSEAIEALPLLFWLVESSCPRVSVTLGLEDAVPYFAQCQAIEKLGIDTVSFGIQLPTEKTADLAATEAYNTEHYEEFSQIIQINHAEAVNFLEETKVDFLIVNQKATRALQDEIDQHWLPRMSSRGVIVFLGGGEALSRYVARVCQGEGQFTLDPGKGICVALRGTDHNDRLSNLCQLKVGKPGYLAIRNVFQRAGELHGKTIAVERLKTDQETSERQLLQERDAVKKLQQQVREKDEEYEKISQRIKEEIEPVSTAQYDVSDYPLLAELTQMVMQDESYEVTALLDSPGRPSDRSVLVAVEFNNEEGERVPVQSSVSVSARVGPYSYMSMASGDVPRLVASFTAPTGAVKMIARIILWKASTDLALGKADIVWLDRPDRIVSSGEAEARNNEWCTLNGRIRVEGGSGERVALVDFKFMDADRQQLVNVAQGLSGSDRFTNYAYAQIHHAETQKEADLHVAFLPPKGAQTVKWRLQGWNGYRVTVLEDFYIRGRSLSPTRYLAKLPDTARAARDITPEEIEQLRSKLPMEPIWHNVAKNTLGLLAEAMVKTTAQGWIEVSGTLNWPNAKPEQHRPVLCPIYFANNGTLLEPAHLIGCAKSKQEGFCRYPALHPDSENPDRLDFREAFLTPPDAVFAVILLLTSNGEVEAINVTSFSCETGGPHMLFRALDTSVMDNTQLSCALEMAETVSDLPSQRALYSALALLNPTQKKNAAHAQSLAAQIAELNCDWLPVLSQGRTYTPAPEAVMHLMKVIYPDAYSDSAIRSTSIMEAQAARGLKPVACMPLAGRRDVEADGPDGVVEVVRDGVTVNYLQFPLFAKQEVEPIDTLQFETTLHNRVVQQHKISLIHAASGFRGYENALKGLALSRANDLPFVYEVRSPHEHQWRPIDAMQLSDKITMLREAQEDRCMAGADAVATTSQAMVDHLKKRGVPEDKLFCVPTSISESFRTQVDLETVAHLRQEWDLAGKTTIGNISDFSRGEGHIVLLDAFTLLIEGGHDLYLVLAGEGVLRETIQDEVRKRNLIKRVVLPGGVDPTEMRAWYRSIDLFVVPRVADLAADYVTPLRPLEAMSQGVPVIISERPMTREIAGSDAERAAIFPAEDAKALAQEIARQFANPDRMLSRAELAKDWVLSERIWAKTVERYDAIYAAARKEHARRNMTRSAR